MRWRILGALITHDLMEDGRLMVQLYNRGGPLNRGLISHSILQLFRGIDYWPLNGGWPLNRWPLNGGSCFSPNPYRIWFVMIEWPSNEAQSFCVWFEVKWSFNWRRICAVIFPTPGTCLTTGLVTNLTRNIAKDSFSWNSSQLYISAKTLSRWYEFITRDWGSLPFLILH